MKKIIIPLGVLALLLLTKKDKEVNVPIVPVDSNDVLASITNTFNDNNLVVSNAEIVKIKNEVSVLSQSEKDIVNSYFKTLNDGGDITKALQKNFDTIAPKVPTLILKLMSDAKKQASMLQARTLTTDDGGELSGIWSVADEISNFINGGRVIFGVALFVGNLFCGKKCKMRRLERANG